MPETNLTTLEAETERILQLLDAMDLDAARDLHATSWGDTGIVTFVLEQTYTLNETHQTLEAPTTMVFRRCVQFGARGSRTLPRLGVTKAAVLLASARRASPTVLSAPF